MQVSYLDEQGFLEDGYDIINPTEFGSAFTPELLILLNTLLLSDTDFQKVKSRGALAKQKMTPGAATVLEEVLKIRVSQYATSIEEDKAMLIQDNLPYRKRMAVQVRLGEKTVLKMAQEELSEKSLQPEEKSAQKRNGPSGGLNGHNKRAKMA